MPEDQLQQKEGELIVGEEMRWMVDFPTAIQKGMGFKVPLTKAQFDQGFDRLFVVGVRMSGDETTGQQALALLTHHSYAASGFSLLPQGTPTNNTESGGAGFSPADDDDAAYDDIFKQQALFADTNVWAQKSDGQRLAEFLGIDPTLLKTTHHADATDHAEAVAMNVALWPATLGYMLDTMLQPLLEDAEVESVRWFFTNFVSGRGALPAIRIGRQPYGILPATAFSRLKWLKDAQTPPVRSLPESGRHGKALTAIYKVLRTMAAEWQRMARNVAYVGKAVDAQGKAVDAQAILLDVLGLHPTSVEFHQRYARSREQILNLLKFGDNPAAIEEAETVLDSLELAARNLLKELGDQSGESPEILKKYFTDAHYQLQGPVVDDRPLSEWDPIRAYTGDGKNYIQWLIETASLSG